jgi:hypothetical protein
VKEQQPKKISLGFFGGCAEFLLCHRDRHLKMASKGFVEAYAPLCLAAAAQGHRAVHSITDVVGVELHVAVNQPLSATL